MTSAATQTASPGRSAWRSSALRRRSAPTWLWLYLTSYIVLLGAEINAESERQTREDTTKGKAAAMGERRATAADELAER